MAVTRSRSVERASVRQITRKRQAWRVRELFGLLVCGALVAAGLYQVHKEKSAPLADIEASLASKKLLNLNELSTREELLPALAPLFPKVRDRDNAAKE